MEKFENLMAISAIKSAINKNLGRDEKVPIEQQLAKLEDDIRKLKIDFDIFFAGGTKRPPHEARGRVESQIKRIADDRALTYAQRYHYNTVVSKFISYRELWRRTFKARGIDSGL
ncbi:MAG: hypothetical protein MUC29_13735 [Pyrinomonadaceae bacterium]|jgi:hypothetical protein|nr:hypothetical protein [Pyrinomonadaceae bacterium]